jgi:hypothetical protein
MKNINILYMKQNTIRKGMKSKSQSNKNMHTSKNKTKRYTGAGQGSSKSKKVEKVSKINEMARRVKQKIPDFYIPDGESVKEILKSIKSLGLDKGTIVEQDELITLLYTSMKKILDNKPSTVTKKQSPQRPTPTVTKKQSPQRPTPTATKKHSPIHDDVEHIEKKRQTFNIVINNESSSADGFDETLEYMTPLEKIEAINKIAPNLAKTLEIEKDISKMKIKEIKDILDVLVIDYSRAVDKESLLELLGKVGKNKYLDDVLNSVVATRHGKHDKTEEEKRKKEEEKRKKEQEKQREMRKKLDDILSGEIQKFGFNEVREILQHMSNVDKIDLIKKRMKPKLGNMLNTDLTTMKRSDELLSLLDILGIPIPKGATDRRDLEIIINIELNRVGSNKKIDDLFVDVLNELVKERDEKHKEEEKKHKEAMKKHEADVKKQEAAMKKYNEDVKKYNEQQEAIRRAEEKKKRQEQVQDINGRIWNKSIHTDGKPYYWNAVTGESVWVLPGQVPPPPPPVYAQTQGYTYVYDPNTARQAEAENELRSIPRHLRHGDNYNSKNFAHLPNNTWL